jgi:hypothetical protein
LLDGSMQVGHLGMRGSGLQFRWRQGGRLSCRLSSAPSSGRAWSLCLLLGHGRIW